MPVLSVQMGKFLYRVRYMNWNLLLLKLNNVFMQQVQGPPYMMLPHTTSSVGFSVTCLTVAAKSPAISMLVTLVPKTCLVGQMFISNLKMNDSAFYLYCQMLKVPLVVSVS